MTTHVAGYDFKSRAESARRAQTEAVAAETYGAREDAVEKFEEAARIYAEIRDEADRHRHEMYRRRDVAAQGGAQ